MSQSTRIILIPFVLALPLSAGEVTGSVTDFETGAPIPNAIVSIHFRAPETGGYGFTAFNATTVSRNPSRFSFTGVPPGFFQICVKTPNPLYIDQCLWEQNSNTVELAAGQTVDVGAVRVQRGHPLTITIRDPARLLPARNPAQREHVLASDTPVWIRSPVLGMMPLMAQQSADRRTFQVLVPFDVDIPLNVAAGGNAILDPLNNKRVSRFSRVVRFRRESPRDFDFEVQRR